MRYLEAKPHAALHDWVKCYWFLEKDYTAQSGETILPDGCIDLIFSDGQVFRPYPASFLIGPLSQAVTLPANGQALTIGIRFYPYGIYPFLRHPLYELTNQVIDADVLFGGEASKLAEKVIHSNPQIAFNALDQFLQTRLQDDQPDMGMVKASTHLLRRPENPIRHIAEQMMMSPRTIERKFRQITGFSPKLLASVLRFNRLKNDLILSPSQNLTGLAHRHFYFDQAHFNHDFRHFTGQTPSQFVQQVENGQIRFYR